MNDRPCVKKLILASLSSGPEPPALTVITLNQTMRRVGELEAERDEVALLATPEPFCVVGSTTPIQADQRRGGHRAARKTRELWDGSAGSWSDRLGTEYECVDRFAIRH